MTMKTPATSKYSIVNACNVVVRYHQMNVRGGGSECACLKERERETATETEGGYYNNGISIWM
jgi:hypothetical protein